MASSSDSVLHRKDLEQWEFAGTALAVVGHPIGHSLSPVMHNAALGRLALGDGSFSSWRYFKFDIEPEGLPGALRLFHEKGFFGLNLTVPHKVIAAPLVERIEEDARQAGAVNTLVRTPTGWRGYNTDGAGLAQALSQELKISLEGAPVLILGAGGAARGAAVECLRSGCARLWISNRTPERRAALLSALAPAARKIRLEAFDPGRAQELPTGLVVINATSAGLQPDDAAALDLGSLPRPAAVFDMVYNPPDTQLLRDARVLGIPSASGLGMLVGQGARALEIWSGAPAAATAPTMRAAAQEALRQKEKP